MKDLMSLIHPVPAILPQSVTDNTPLISAIIDRQGFNSLTFLIQSGALADADAAFAVSLTHGDAADLSDGVAVPETGLIGSLALAGFGAVDDGVTRKVGYIGDMRYVRLTITPSSNAAAANIAAMALLGHPALIPTANPPV